MILAPGTRLGPYEILSPIGAGGMGEVWKARDTRLGRIVAIKKVKEQHSERFKQEARTIAALNHPYMCQLHDIGPDYLVLEFVEGKPLTSPLPEQEVIRLAIQIATALEVAHKKGIIHRDLKPANIMVTDDGSVKLLDFGLAKLYEQSASESTAEFPATQAGAVLGTVAYMSPEQAQGQPSDARSDIFSFGLVLYKMLSGRRAFSGESPMATAAALMRDEPPPLQSSPSLEKIVRRCLAKLPSGRYQAISEVRAALEALYREVESNSPAEPQPSIAVLPFVNMSGDKEQEYFSDGLAEEIINALTQIPGLKVTARTSSFSFRGKETDIGQIRDRLKVHNILEGSVRKSGNRIRVTAQLINTADEYHLWSERFDREMTDVFAIQDEICRAIVDKLRIKLSVGGPMIKHRSGNVEAYNLYLKGRYHLLKITSENFTKSREYFEQAIAVDPNSALAWYGLALLYFLLSGLGFMPSKAAKEHGRRFALKALELDETLPQIHALLGALWAIEFDWKGAEREFRRALEISSEAPDILMEYGFTYLMPMGRLKEALAVSQKALELDPLWPALHVQAGLLYSLIHQEDLAIKKFHDALELDPQYSPAHYGLSVSYLLTGKMDEAIREMETAAQLMGRSQHYAALVGFTYARAGRISEARRILEELQQHAARVDLAIISLALDEIDKGFDLLEKAIDEGEDMGTPLFISRLLEPWHSHPRWKALLRKMNLADLPEAPDP